MAIGVFLRKEKKCRAWAHCWVGPFWEKICIQLIRELDIGVFLEETNH